MQIEKESVAEFYHGHTPVGSSAAPLVAFDGVKALKGVFFRCPGTIDEEPNTVPVYIGGPHVTADTEATGGIPVIPGGTMFIPIDDPNKLYVIATEEDQDIAWMVV